MDPLPYPREEEKFRAMHEQSPVETDSSEAENMMAYPDILMSLSMGMENIT
jgi:hypothetical protein